MLIARVVGNIVSTQKHADYMGQKLLILRALDPDGGMYGPELVALDGADTHAGIGDTVLLIQEGGSARQASRIDHKGPVEYCVGAIVDFIESSRGSYRQQD